MPDNEPAATKWIWSPTSDQYKEWKGSLSHPEIADMLWKDTPDWEQVAKGNWWGGAHYSTGATDIYWFPLNLASSNEAKQNAPIELLEHLRKRRLNR